MKAKRIVFTQVNRAELLDWEVESPGPGQALVKTAFTAVSAGTERANLTGDANINPASQASVSFPRYAGYSGAGVVMAVGPGVTRVKVGDRVGIHWGSHLSWQTLPEENLHKLPDSVSLQEAAVTFISTFSAAALRKLHPALGESILVMGLGILGQFAVQLARANGMVPVIAADPKPERRALALTLGADYALDPTADGFAEKVKELTGGGANMAIEVTGHGEALNQALDCMKPFGRVALLGCTRDSNFTLDYYRKVHFPGITLVGAHTAARPALQSNSDVWTYDDDFSAIFKLIQGGRLDYKKMVSEIHSPAEAPAVYARLAENTDFPIGLLFDWSKLDTAP